MTCLGTHQELMELQGAYYELTKKQQTKKAENWFINLLLRSFHKRYLFINYECFVVCL